MEPLKNLGVNLKATGPAAVLIALILSIAALGILGGEKSGTALSILGFLAGMVGLGLVQKIKDE